MLPHKIKPYIEGLVHKSSICKNQLFEKNAFESFRLSTRDYSVNS